VTPAEIAGASVFTTQSIDAISRKIRAQLPGGAMSFNLGTGGERTVFPLLTVSSITWQRQIGTAPSHSEPSTAFRCSRWSRTSAPE